MELPNRRGTPTTPGPRPTRPAPAAVARAIAARGAPTDLARTRAAGVRAALVAAAVAVALAAAGLGLAGCDSGKETVAVDREVRPHFMVITDPKYPQAKRRQAADELAGKGAKAIDPMLKALDHADAYGRALATQVLGKVSGPGATEGILRSLSDPAWEVRRTATAALARKRDPKAIGPLAEVGLAKDERPEVRTSAIEALAKIRDPKVLPALVTLTKAPAADARQVALGALGRFQGEADAAEALMAALDDADAGVRAAAAGALALVAEKDQVTAALDRLEAILLEDESARARAAAAVSLGKLGDADAVGPLVRALEDSDALVAQEARDSLARIGRPAMEPCIEALRSDDPETRFAAARAIEALARANVRDDRSVRPLIELLRETEEAMVAKRGTREVKVTDWSNRMKWIGSALVAVTGVNRDPTFRTGYAHWGRWWDSHKNEYP